MSIFIVDAERLKNVMEAIMLVNYEPEMKVTSTELLVRAVDVAQKFSIIVRLYPSWFRYYGIDRHRACESRRVNVECFYSYLDPDNFRHVCIFTVNELELQSFLPKLLPFVSNLGINIRQTNFHHYNVEEGAGWDALPSWPEERAIDCHKYNLEIHPQDVKSILETAIESNFATVTIHITNRRVTLTAGQNVRIYLQVCNSVTRGLNCRISYDSTKGIASSSAARVPSTYLPPEGLELTLRLHSPTHKPLLKPVSLAESFFLHFSHSESYYDLSTKEPPVFRCVLAGEEGSAATFYFILPY